MDFMIFYCSCLERLHFLKSIYNLASWLVLGNGLNLNKQGFHLIVFASSFSIFVSEESNFWVSRVFLYQGQTQFCHTNLGQH